MTAAVPPTPPLYHVTPVEYLNSILSTGLDPHAAVRNFRTAPAVYLAESEEDARRWAREIARQRGGPIEVALLEVDRGGLPMVRSAAEEVSIGTPQQTVRSAVPPASVRYVDSFVAEPQTSHGLYIERVGVDEHGVLRFVCTDCGSTYSKEAAADHVAEMDSEEEDE